MDSLTVPATLESLEIVHQFIIEVTTQLGLDDRAAWQVQLAVDEAVTNVIQHGYGANDRGSLVLNWEIDNGDLQITIRDRGRTFNPEDVPAPDITSPLEERQAGGLGLFLMNKLMDVVRFDQHSGENTLVMRKRLQRPASNISSFALSGRMDAVASQQALERPRAAIASGARRVLLDLSGVSFLSSSGLRALLLLRKDLMAQGGELRLCALQPQVQEVFVLTGFTQVFAIHSTREEALAAFGRG